MIAYDPAAWSDFFVATAGAAAALAGLLVVAMSINLKPILGHDGLPERGAETLLMLISALVAALFVLAPGQSDTALGVELIVLGGLSAATLFRLQFAARNQAEQTLPRTLARIAIAVPASIPLTIGGVSLVATAGGGLYWVLAATIAIFIGSAINAWVLLVEILR